MTSPSNALKVFLVLLVLACTVTAAYTVPGKVPIQGRLTNVSTGVALTGPYNFTFRVYNASTDGTKLWEENQSLTVDYGGLWSTYLGNNTSLDLNFSEDTYIEIEINHDGDPLPRVQLTTVPYSKRTDIAANLSCVDCIGGAEINESTLVGVNASSFNGQASGYFLNISTPFGGDVSGTYGSLEVNASKIDTGTLNRSFIEDAYLLNTGDNASGNYSFDSGALYVDSTNHRIGIGTSTPTVKLDVQGGVNAALNLTTPLVCLNGDCRTTWPTGSGISSAGGWANTSSETYSSLNVNLSNKFFYNASSGYVGIGTTDPTVPLSLFSAINAPLSIDNSGGVPGIQLYNNGTRKWVIASRGTDSDNLFFSPSPISTTGPNLASAAKVTIQQSGNVGIGTTSPSAKLDVAGDFEVDGSDFFVNSTSGSIGIGTTGPKGALHVAGTTGITYAAAGAGEDGLKGLVTIGDAGTSGGSLVVRTASFNSNYPSGLGVDGTYASQNSVINLKAYGVDSGGGYGSSLAFFTTNGLNSVNEAMRIDKSGNVGIGTTSPSAKLDVAGDFEVDGSDFFVNSTSGNVGIGTTSPETKLQVTGGNIALSFGHLVTGSASEISSISALYTDYAPSLVSAKISFKDYYTGTSWYDFADRKKMGISFHTLNAGSLIEAVTITNTGNVGIGTTGPSTRLHIRGLDDAGTQLRIESYDNDTAVQASVLGLYRARGAIASPLPLQSGDAIGNIIFYGRGQNDWWGGAQIIASADGEWATAGDITDNPARLTFLTTPDGAWEPLERVRIDSTGNVGIGTTVPLVRLDVRDGSAGGTQFTPNTDYTAFIGSYANTGTKNGLLVQSAWYTDANAVIAQFSALDTGYVEVPRMTIKSNGKVGIGTTSPGYQLTLSTNSAAKPTSDHWTISSDVRLKENITEIPNALQIVLQLKGREFEYINKEQYGASRQYGFIAQDVESVIPRWVQTGVDGYKTLTIAGDTALLVEAIKDQQGVIQDQQGAIQDQQKQMDNLKAENEALKADNEALKQAVCEINPNASICAGM
jgi:hypothetical protein